MASVDSLVTGSVVVESLCVLVSSGNLRISLVNVGILPLLFEAANEAHYKSYKEEESRHAKNDGEHSVVFEEFRNLGIALPGGVNAVKSHLSSFRVVI
jgi:hypothetical protein